MLLAHGQLGTVNRERARRPVSAVTSAANRASHLARPLIVCTVTISVLVFIVIVIAVGSDRRFGALIALTVQCVAESADDTWSHVSQIRDTYGNCPSDVRSAEWQVDMAPCVIMDVWRQSSAPFYSIIVTVWNQQNIIRRVVSDAVSYARGSFELIIVMDGCRDESIRIVQSLLWKMTRECTFDWDANTSVLRQVPGYEWESSATDDVDKCINMAMMHVRVLYTASGVWETAANNIALRNSDVRSRYLVLLQDDMFMLQVGYNEWLSLPARLWPAEVVGVSGRCAEQWYTAASPNNTRGGVRCWPVDQPLGEEHTKARCTFFVRDAAYRGPLLLVADRARKLNFFDDVNFHMDYSDHDLFARAYFHARWIGGALPLNWVSDTALGGTRAPPGSKPAQLPSEALAYERLKSKYATHNGTNFLVRNAGSRLGWFSHDEDRQLPGQIYQYCLAHVRSEQAWFANATLMRSLSALYT